MHLQILRKRWLFLEVLSEIAKTEQKGFCWEQKTDLEPSLTEWYPSTLSVVERAS